MPLTNDSDDDNDFGAVNQANYRKIQEKFVKVGYADGITAGHDSVFQTGFDTGYVDGFRTAFELAKCQSFYANVPAKKLDKQDLLKEREEYEKMGIAAGAPDAQEHFQFLKYPGESLDTISKHQQAYVDEVLHKCASTLPLTTSLLATPAASR